MMEKFTEKIELIEKCLPCRIIYHPGPMQIELSINVNNTPVKFVYDEEYINSHDFEDIMSRIDDDLFLAGNRINTGR